MALKYEPRMIAHFITEVNDNASKPLSKWEASFMASVTDQWDRSGRISERQLELLERIYAEKTA